VYKRSTNFGAGLVQLHQQAGVLYRLFHRQRRQAANQGVYQVTEKHVPTGLWSQNRPEWQLSDIACMSQSLYSVSIYDTLGPDTAVYIINHAELTTVVASLVVSILSHVPTTHG
jgi:long-chain acyl-CoA synthetase